MTGAGKRICNSDRMCSYEKPYKNKSKTFVLYVAVVSVVGIMIEQLTTLSLISKYSPNLETISEQYSSQSQNSVTENDDHTTSAPSMAPTTLFREDYFTEENGIQKGVLSTKPKSFFEKFQKEIDNYDLKDRCLRYNFGMHAKPGEPERPKRRIFYGALIAEEPWELLDIMATETHGIFAGMVFVESNRTQAFYGRTLKRFNSPKQFEKIKEMFGVEQLQIRNYVNENSKDRDLDRENLQRQEILIGWKEMGMTKDDIGYITDTDEAFTRDFLRAVEQCPRIAAFDYKHHKCEMGKTKILGGTRVFESSPECVTKHRSWFHPDIIIGACIEEIGDESVNPRAPRNGYQRAVGWANDCNTNPDSKSMKYIVNNSFPLYSAGDFRMQCGGHFMHTHKVPSEHSGHSAFHLHNFFANFTTTRNKYLTYGHPLYDAMTRPLEEIHSDIRLVVRCVYNQTDGPTKRGTPIDSEYQDYHRLVGGINDRFPVVPIYFYDREYRRRKHADITNLVKEDERLRLERLNLTMDEQRLDDLKKEMREALRFMYATNVSIEQLKASIEIKKAK